MKCLFVRSPFAGWIVDGVKTIEHGKGMLLNGKPFDNE